MNAVIGWTNAYDGIYPTVPFNDDRRKALIERIRKRNYNFNHFDHEFLPYGCPFYDDNVLCVLTKSQWDEVMDEVYKDVPRGPRLMPEDIIERRPINSVLYEKEKFEPKDGESNG
jgi:hypothetical protein